MKVRDGAILARLRVGPASFDELAAALPREDGQIPTGACTSAVKRLQVKKLIRVVPEGWALA